MCVENPYAKKSLVVSASLRNEDSNESGVSGAPWSCFQGSTAKRNLKPENHSVGEVNHLCIQSTNMSDYITCAESNNQAM